VLIDRVKATSALIKRTGRAFGEALTVAGALGSWAIGKLFIQPVRIVASTLNVWQLGRLFSETVRVSGSAITLTGRFFVETINVAGVWVLGTISKLLIEIVKITQFVGNTLPARVFTETIQVIGNAINQNVRVFTEAITVAGEFVRGTISKLLVEVVNIAETFLRTWTLSRVFTEVVNAIDYIWGGTSRVFSEVITVAVSYVPPVISKLLKETINVGQSIVFAMTRVFVEVVNVGESLIRAIGRTFAEVFEIANPAVRKLTGRTFSAAITVGVSLKRVTSRTFTQVIRVVGNIWQLGASFILYETIAVASAMGNFVIGKLLKETVVAAWHRAKFVLNGIQVGLWKKVARVTNGLWRKINRNDN
jgi:hypothetical protein